MHSAVLEYIDKGKGWGFFCHLFLLLVLTIAKRNVCVRASDLRAASAGPGCVRTEW